MKVYYRRKLIRTISVITVVISIFWFPSHLHNCKFVSG
jgi:hypothetical protein